jgi:hypothetical protein
LTLSTVVVISTVPATTHDVFVEGNLRNISPTIPIDISIKPGIVENVHIGASCSSDEIVRCRFYQIGLNPHKCVFCVESDCLLGFIVSRQGIRVDPLKVEAILNLPPPSTLFQLQSLQGKENFLHRFIPNYAEITRGFTWLLKKDSEFIWDTIANNVFEDLKFSLM